MNAQPVRRAFAVVVNTLRFLPIAELFNELLAADFSRPVACDDLNRVIASVSFFHFQTSAKKIKPAPDWSVIRCGFNLRVTVKSLVPKQAANQQTKN